MRRTLLNEYKNVSTEVYEFSEQLYDMILDNSDNTQMKKSRINGFLYIENNFVADITSCKKWIFKNIDKLSVRYVLYVAETTKEYNYIMQNVDFEANSESDYNKRTITIVSGFINGYIASDFHGTICHEVNHLFEYDNGREKRVDLYDKVRELLSKNDTDANIVVNAIYYSFQHEIDAFVHEFYGFLQQEKPNHLRFEELVNYSEYNNANYAYKNFLSRKDNPNIIKWINYLGYSRRDYIKRIKYGLQRLYRKIKNAYLRYRLENRVMTEGLIHRLQKNEKIRMEESRYYNTDIQWDIEVLYNF
jgi:hypothetical protein